MLVQQNSAIPWQIFLLILAVGCVMGLLVNGSEILNPQTAAIQATTTLMFNDIAYQSAVMQVSATAVALEAQQVHEEQVAQATAVPLQLTAVAGQNVATLEAFQSQATKVALQNQISQENLARVAFEAQTDYDAKQHVVNDEIQNASQTAGIVVTYMIGGSLALAVASLAYLVISTSRRRELVEQRRLLQLQASIENKNRSVPEPAQGKGSPEKVLLPRMTIPMSGASGNGKNGHKNYPLAG